MSVSAIDLIVNHVKKTLSATDFNLKVPVTTAAGDIFFLIFQRKSVLKFHVN